MRQRGFYWVVLSSETGMRFVPVVAWWQPDGWRLAGSTAPLADDIGVEVLTGPLLPPSTGT